MGRKPAPKPRKATVVRYVGPDGRRCKKGDPGATAVKTTTDAYYLELPPAVKGGKPERIPLGTTDLGAAWVRVRDILRDRATGGLYSEQDRQAMRPISQHLDEWLAALAAAGAKPDRVGMLRARMEAIIDAAKWQRITDIRKSTCAAAIATVGARSTPKTPQGLSNQTKNHYQSHAQQFAAWLAGKGEQRLPNNPLLGMRKLPVEGHEVHARRPPTDEEVVLLLEHLHSPAAKIRMRMSGPQRELGYQISLCTGYRAGEVRSLTRDHFDLEAGTIRLAARTAKSRKRTTIPIPAWLREKLRAWFDGGGGLWSNFPATWPGRLLRADLDLARALWIRAAPDDAERKQREQSNTLRYETEDLDGPLFLDFHALRHWYISAVAGQADVSPAVLQALSRHSDPKLTLKIYTHAKGEGRRAAAEQIQMPTAAKPTPKAE